MEKKKNNQVIVGLAGLLLLVVVASAAVLWFLPPAQPLTVAEEPENPASDTAAFDFKLFNRSEYQTLNFQLVTSGSLPVEPPTTIGKTNPFL